VYESAQEDVALVVARDVPYRLSLSDGELDELSWPVGTEWLRVPAGRHRNTLVLTTARDTARPLDVELDPILVLDLATLADADPGDEIGELLQLPDGANGQSKLAPIVELAPSGAVVWIDQSSRNFVPAAIHNGVEWSTDRGALVEAYGSFAAFGGESEEVVLRGLDVVGTELWRNPSVAPAEGERYLVQPAANGVALVAGCWDGPRADCDRHEIGGVDMATGEVLWHLPGDRQLGPAEGASALVTEEPDAWVMIDVLTGEEIEGQRWEGADRFEVRCCADHEADASVLNLGGVVVASDLRTAAFYYPVDAGLVPQTVSLP
jgi:hypothetical protein